MLEVEYSGFFPDLVNTMPADALAPSVARASAGMVLAAKDRQHVLMFQSKFHYMGQAKYKMRFKM